MPTNLNALIRYKQIDLELRNPYLKSTIKGLQEACSKQLEEHRGVYKLVSERTIRDDIRVMRSEALGFNAPIVVNGGVYSYSDSNYTIFNIKIQELDILKEVLYLLIEEKDKIKNGNLNKVMKALSKLTGIDLVEKEKPKQIIPPQQPVILYQKGPKISVNECKGFLDLLPFSKKHKYEWRAIFELI